MPEIKKIDTGMPEIQYHDENHVKCKSFIHRELYQTVYLHHRSIWPLHSFTFSTPQGANYPSSNYTALRIFIPQAPYTIYVLSHFVHGLAGDTNESQLAMSRF